MGAKVLAPSRVWFPGRRGTQTCRGAHPYFAGSQLIRAHAHNNREAA
jgi:hypothetical protein